MTKSCSIMAFTCLFSAQSTRPQSWSTDSSLLTLRNGPEAKRDERRMGTNRFLKAGPRGQTCEFCRSGILVIIHPSFETLFIYAFIKACQIPKRLLPIVYLGGVQKAHPTAQEQKQCLPRPCFLWIRKTTSSRALPDINRFLRLFQGRARFGTSETYPPR